MNIKITTKESAQPKRRFTKEEIVREVGVYKCVSSEREGYIVVLNALALYVSNPECHIVERFNVSVWPDCEFELATDPLTLTFSN